jgi:DEAD/DEAH box helicase domain-containing protein
VGRGQTFIAIYDQTYGSLRLSSRLLDGDLLPRVLKRARELADASDLRENEPLTARALDEFTSIGTADLQDLTFDATAPGAGASVDKITVIMPKSWGLDVSHNNHLFTVTAIFFSPKLQSVAYRGRRETTPDNEDVVDIVAVNCLVAIPGESLVGAYDPETGDLQELGKA